MNVVSEYFHQLAAGPVRPLDWQLGISWSKELDNETAWFTLDQSTLNGSDILADNNQNPIMMWDAYDYENSRDRVISINVERSVQFPYNIQSAVMDVKLNNYDGYYTYANEISPISEYILPSRPIRSYLGFSGAGLTPVFVGLTEAIPEYSGVKNEVASMSALDFLAAIGDMQLKEVVMMRDVRTDEVIEVILQQFGLSPSMYNLKHGINVIPFVYYSSGKNAGNALKELIQAENGAMWIDEQGVIRFEPRTSIIGQDPVMEFSSSSIVSIEPSGSEEIINTVNIEVDIRKVQDFQPIFTADNSNGYSGAAADDSYRIPANGSKVIWFSLDDPAWTASDFVFDGPADDSSFTAVNLSGEAVTSGLSATDGTLFADSYKVTFNNANNYPVSLNYVQLWGQPAKVVGESPSIKYNAYDEKSVEAFGVRELTITDNQCFGSYQNVDSYAESILERYKDYNPTITMEVKGDPSLQMQDMFTISDGDYAGTWIILGISHKLEDSKLTTKIKARRQEVMSPFTLDVSQLNGPDVLG